MEYYIEKSVETSAGVPATIWRINNLSIDIDNQIILFNFLGYYDIQAYLNGANSLTGIDQSINLDGETDIKNIYLACYEVAVNMVEFLKDGKINKL